MTMSKVHRVSLALFVSLLTIGPAISGAKDYTFVPLTTKISMSHAAQQPLEIKLVDKAGNPVSGAAITRVRLDMAPDGMAQHSASARLASTDKPGIYRLEAEYSMTGRWQLSLTAKVPGETETVSGKLVVSVAK